MTAAPSFPNDMQIAFAQLIAGAGAGVWHADGSAYAATDLAITFKRLADMPPRQICLSYYPVQSDPKGSQFLGGVQVRTRGSEDPSDVDAIDDTIYNVLHGLLGVTSNGYTFAQIWHQSGATLGIDGSGRWQRSSNFYFWTSRETNAVTD